MKSACERKFDKLHSSGYRCGLSWQDFDIIYNYSQGVYVEIGTLEGASAWAASFEADEVHTVDIQDMKHIWENDNYKRNNVIFYLGDSIDIAERWPKEKKIDTLFIDGEHRYDAVWEDLNAWILYLNDGATIMFHDFATHSPEVLTACIEFINSGQVDGKVFWPPENSSILRVIYRRKDELVRE